MRKVHLSLPVTDLAATETFYATLFDDRPSKQKPDYLKFEPEELALNISFIPTDALTSADTKRYLGIQYSSPQELDTAFDRLSAVDLVTGSRETGTCCYADQDKFWVRDPDGYEWELYYLLSDSDTKIQEGTRCCATKSDRSTCC